MRARSMVHLSPRALLDRVTDLLARERGITAELVLCLAEVLRRRLHVAEGYPSLFAYCVQHLGLSEDGAWKRIRVARIARRFPRIVEMLGDGRLHLSAVVLLAPHLTRETADELLAAATRRSKRQIEQFLAERFPQPDVQPEIRPMALAMSPPAPISPVTAPLTGAAAAATGDAAGPPAPVHRAGAELAPGPVLTFAAGPGSQGVPAPETRPRVAPLAPQRYAVQFTMDQAMHDYLRRAQELLGHRVAPGQVTEVFRRALRELVTKLEREKFAATARLRTAAATQPGEPACSVRPRHIPAAVRREVWARDQGRCTFVGDSGHRCDSRSQLEFDHVRPVARGGESTAGNLRLRCRAHNQYEAERAFGEGFMHGIRERARSVRG